MPNYTDSLHGESHGTQGYRVLVSVLAGVVAVEVDVMKQINALVQEAR